MRFEVSRVMDTIERRLTTDIVMAQAVVDLDAITRYTDLDSGRPVNLIRIGMVVDALGRYLRDGGAMIYAVAPRTLLSEPELTAKERMVLGRWTEDGLIESTEDAAAARVLEIGELTGLPIISRDGYRTLAAEHEWLRDHPLRILTVSRRFGGARLIDGTDDAAPPPPTATGSSAGPQSAGPESAGPELAGPELAGSELAGSELAGPESAGSESAGPESAGPELAGDGASAGALSEPEPAADATQGRAGGSDQVQIWPDPNRPVYEPLPEPPAYLPAPNARGAELIARLWRCDGYNCPSFGTGRRLGQPVPHLREGEPVCPRHGEPLVDVGARPSSVPVALIVDGLRRSHFVVVADRPVFVGRAPEEPDAVAVGGWLHEAATSWISRTHLRLEVRDGRLVATDMSTNGTVVWVRRERDDRPDTFRLRRGKSYPLGEWDSVEMYTGIELCRADRRPKGVDESHDEPSSVLTDAPTLSLHLLPPPDG